jgi:hypothetical protein
MKPKSIYGVSIAIYSISVLLALLGMAITGNVLLLLWLLLSLFWTMYLWRIP